jgi:hypothetical protein
MPICAETSPSCSNLKRLAAEYGRIYAAANNYARQRGTTCPDSRFSALSVTRYFGLVEIRAAISEFFGRRENAVPEIPRPAVMWLP